MLTNAPAGKGKKTREEGLTSQAETVTGEAKTENNFKNYTKTGARYAKFDRRANEIGLRWIEKLSDDERKQNQV